MRTIMPQSTPGRMESEFRFECARCSACCGGSPGYVWVAAADAERILGFLGIGFSEFFERYCRLVEGPSGFVLSLKERKNFSCIFLGAKGCDIYPARPVQCRSYPFWENIVADTATWKTEAAWCPGIGRGMALGKDDIESRLADRRGNAPLVFSSRHEAMRWVPSAEDASK
jgi:Fe-S-cluster containining protein